MLQPLYTSHMAMPRILTLTMNPALDRATTAARVEPTHKLRCSQPVLFSGGGGVNVARVLHRLGADVSALYTTGGPAGTVLRRLLDQEGVPSLCVPIADDTRENLAVIDRSNGNEYRFVMPGPQMTEAEWHACLDAVAALSPAPEWIVASGSLPLGVPQDFYVRLAEIARRHGSRLVLDSSGPELAAALNAGVYLVKPSLRELRELSGLPLNDAPAWEAAALGLVHRQQAQIVALSLGDQGAMLACAQGVWHVPALSVNVAGATGAGDSFVAGMVWALMQDLGPGQALRWAVAAATAALLTHGTSLAHPEDMRRLLEQVPPAPF